MFDLIIKNATIIDGSGAAAYAGDLAVKDGKIAAIAADGKGFGPGVLAKEVFDAKGLVVTPGFIDIHSHSDLSLHVYPKSESRILQGVTTEIAGNCGESLAPLNTKNKDLLQAYVGEAPFTWRSFGEYLDYMEKGEFSMSKEGNGLSANFAGMVGHGNIRIMAMGFDRRHCTMGELEDMKSILSDTIDEGAFAMTSGLIYPPGSFCDTHELAQLATVLGKKGVYYATHMRNESNGIESAIDEALKIARAGNCSLEISHFKLLRKPNWGKIDRMIEMVEEGQKAGMDITCDQYPYIASSTGLSSNLPGWIFEGGIDEVVRKLGDPQIRAKAIAESEEGHKGRWDTIYIGYTASEEFKGFIGKNIEEVVQATGLAGAEIICRIVEQTGNDSSEISFGQLEENVQRIMKLPYVMTGSDGNALSLDCPGRPHPRNFGTFTRVLGHYSRDLKLFSLETAVNKMTGMPAARVGLKDRGLIKEGNWADLVIFDRDKILDTATFEKPQQASAGIIRVYVNGVLTAENGVHTGARAGQVLRRK